MFTPQLKVNIDWNTGAFSIEEIKSDSAEILKEESGLEKPV